MEKHPETTDDSADYYGGINPVKMPGENKEREDDGYKAVLVSARVLIRILLGILFVVFLIFLSRKAYSLGYEVVSYQPSENEEAADQTVTITMDMSIRDVGKLLIDRGILKESLDAFLIQERLSDYHDMFLPGTYSLNETMTVEQILETISTKPEEDAPQ